jgi:hypothetical protein
MNKGKMVIFSRGKFVTKAKTKSVVTKVMTITPAIALLMLEKNTKNRKLNKNAVTKYVQDIKRGRWGVTAAGIGFYTDGTISDGQHRLKAIIKADTAVEVLVVFNIKPETAAGASCFPRSSAAIAEIVLGEIMKGHLAACGFYLQIEGIRGKTSESQLIDFYKSIKEDVDFVIETFNKHLAGSKPAKGVMTCYVHAALIAAKLDGDGVTNRQLDNYIRVLVTGVAKTDQEITIIKFRDRILQNGHVSNGGTDRVEYFLRTQKNLKDYINKNPKGIGMPKRVIWEIPSDLVPEIL